MKKSQLLQSLAVVATMAILGLGAQQVHADDLGKTSVGEFTVTAGNLQLDQVPDFNFGSTDIATLSKGTTLKYSDSDAGAKSNTLSVSDYRGASTSDWSLTAKLSAFKNASDGNASNISGEIKFITSATTTSTISSADSNIWTSDQAGTKGVGSASATVKNDTALTTAANTAINGGTYDSTVTWTLGNTSATSAD